MADKHIFTLRGSIEGGAYVTEKNGGTSIELRLRRAGQQKRSEHIILCIVCRRKGSRDGFDVFSTEINGSTAYEFNGNDVCAVMIAEKKGNQVNMLCNGFRGLNQMQSARAAYEVRGHILREYKEPILKEEKQKDKEQVEEVSKAVAQRVLKAGEAYRSNRMGKTNAVERTELGGTYRNRSEAVRMILDQASRLFYPMQENKTVGGIKNEPVNKKESIASSETEAIPNPFPISFPNSYWWHDGRGKPIYGKANAEGRMLSITAVEGKWSPRPPRNLKGFNKYYTAYDGKGYWLRITYESKSNSNIGKR